MADLGAARILDRVSARIEEELDEVASGERTLVRAAMRILRETAS